MTTAEMLAFVEAQIRKDMPRLMELREGCWFINFNGNKHKSLGWCINKENNRIHYSIKDEYITYQTEEQMSKIEIIGHDVMLNDVLEWGLMNKLFDVELIYKTLRMKPFKNLLHLNDYGRWDLSKPYLKEQSAELVKFLYNLKKIIK